MSKIKQSFKIRLLTLVLIPLVVVSVSLAVMSAVKVDSLVTSDAEEELLNTARGIRSLLETSTVDPWTEVDGVIYDGEGNDISYFNKAFDTYLSESGLYVTFIWGDTRKATSVKNNGERAVNTQINSDIAKRVLAGEDVIADNVNVAGNNCKVCYIPFINPGTNKVVGSVFVGMGQSALDKAISSAVMSVIAIAVGLGIVAIIVAIIMSNKMAKPIIEAGNLCNALGEGNLSVPDVTVGVERADDIGNMIRSANKLKASLSEIIGNIRTGVETLNDNAKQINQATDNAEESMRNLSSASEEVANGATSQAQEVTNAATSISTITMNMDSIGENVEATNHCTDEMISSSEKVSGQFTQLLTDTEKSMRSLEEISDKMGKVADAVESVIKAADQITGIASQTNLLSLNASIEAARAGEAGRGFAVVASEISSLAKESDETSNTIQAIMKELDGATKSAIEQTNALKDVMNKQYESSQNSQKLLGTLVDNINETVTNVNSVAEGTQAVNDLCRTLNDAISNLSAISEENAASSEETTASIQQTNTEITDIQAMVSDINELADKLSQQVSVFTI